MNIFYCTFGCKVNQYETENIKQALENKQFSTVTEIIDADIAVINTCTVTSYSLNNGYCRNKYLYSHIILD